MKDAKCIFGIEFRNLNTISFAPPKVMISLHRENHTGLLRSKGDKVMTHMFVSFVVLQQRLSLSQVLHSIVSITIKVS